MDIDDTIQQLKSQVLGSLEEHVFQQASAQNLVDNVLRALVEGAVERLQVRLPSAASGVGALLGMLSPVASVVQSLGLDDQIAALVRRYGVDTALRDSVIRGITRYLEANGARLMDVAVKAVIGKLTRP